MTASIDSVGCRSFPHFRNEKFINYRLADLKITSLFLTSDPNFRLTSAKYPKVGGCMLSLFLEKNLGFSRRVEVKILSKSRIKHKNFLRWFFFAEKKKKKMERSIIPFFFLRARLILGFLYLLFSCTLPHEIF